MQGKEFLQSIKNTLEYHRQLGITGYRKDTSLDDFLAKPSVTMVPSGKEGKTGKKMPDLSPETDQVPPQVTSRDSDTYEKLSSEIRTCSKCGMKDSRLFPVVGEGGRRSVRLLIVGDWFRAGQDREYSGIMGVEEDVMVRRMMEAISLGTDQYYVTNVIKCAILKDGQPKAENVEACLPYLFRQIQLYNPEVICTMGLIGTRALLTHKGPLARIRGRFHPFVTESGVKIPVFPVYHPNILSQHMEMKKAAWKDLQFLAKYLGLSPRY